MHSFLRFTSPFPSQRQRIKFLSESAETLCALTYNVLVLEQIHLWSHSSFASVLLADNISFLKAQASYCLREKALASGSATELQHDLSPEWTTAQVLQNYSAPYGFLSVTFIRKLRLSHWRFICTNLLTPGLHMLFWMTFLPTFLIVCEVVQKWIK